MELDGEGLILPWRASTQRQLRKSNKNRALVWLIFAEIGAEKIL
jgi:hypothetical protein